MTNTQESFTNSNPELLWELCNITKKFPGVLANNNISLKLFAGEIHGLMGGNGCGKSTLIKSLAGTHSPDSGQIKLRQNIISLDSPTDARQKGVATVFQEFSLIPTLTVAENIFLGRLPVKNGQIDWQKIHADAKSVLDKLELKLSTYAIVSELSVAEQQLVEIAKAIATDAQLIILDEPTAALGLTEIKHLHTILRRMKSQGRAILYVSHRLDEVVEIVDAITVLKDGEVVSDAESSEVDIDFIVRTMIGDDVDEHYPKQCNKTNTPLLELKSIQTHKGVNNVSFTLHKGEVLGLGGVMGSGRTEILNAIFGIDPLIQGEMKINGKLINAQCPKDSIDSGIALVPENRKFDGLFFNFEGPENITIADLNTITQKGLLSPHKEQSLSQSFIERLQISSAAINKKVGLLSGGNQQKIIIARWLNAHSEVFLLDEPTQGIDVGAKVAVYELINHLTSQNKAVILVSSDHDELIAMSDSIAITQDGTITDLLPASQVSKADLANTTSH